jgi:hypothetical protein
MQEEGIMRFTANRVVMNTRLLAAGILVVILGTCAPLFAGDQTPAPGKAVVQISVTDVDASDGQSLPFPGGFGRNPKSHDDLSDLKAEAAKEGLAITITPRFTITTFDGTAGSVHEQTQIPAMPLGTMSAPPSDSVDYVVLTDSLSLTPHINPDGTISIAFSLAEHKVNGPAWRELGPPNISYCAVTTERTFHNGDTQAIYFPTSGGFEAHRSFLTVKLIPAKKG